MYAIRSYYVEPKLFETLLGRVGELVVEREMIPAFHSNRGSRFTKDGAISVLGAEMIGGST